MIEARPLYFVIDPFSGSRVAIGAIFGEEIKPRLLPLGEEIAFALTPNQTTLVRLALAEIARVPDFDHLPAAPGPQIVFGERLKLPAGVINPEIWLRRLLLPRHRQAA